MSATLTREPALATEGPAPSPSRGRQMLNKVPEITLYFWIIKVLCTTVGETAAAIVSGVRARASSGVARPGVGAPGAGADPEDEPGGPSADPARRRDHPRPPADPG